MIAAMEENRIKKDQECEGGGAVAVINRVI